MIEEPTPIRESWTHSIIAATIAAARPTSAASNRRAATSQARNPRPSEKTLARISEIELRNIGSGRPLPLRIAAHVATIGWIHPASRARRRRRVTSAERSAPRTCPPTSASPASLRRLDETDIVEDQEAQVVRDPDRLAP